MRQYIIEKIASKSKDKYIRSLVEQCDLTEIEADHISHFQLNGCLAINKEDQ